LRIAINNIKERATKKNWKTRGDELLLSYRGREGQRENKTLQNTHVPVKIKMLYTALLPA